MENLRVVDVCNTCRRMVISENSVRDLFWVLDRNGRFYLGEGDLSISFVSKKKMGTIHGQFLGDDLPTDVISFQGDPDLNFAGEIVVCLPYALGQSKIYGTTLGEEVKLYLVHGYLHLCGLEDKSEDEIQKMREGEYYCLNFLKDLPLRVSLKAQ